MACFIPQGGHKNINYVSYHGVKRSLLPSVRVIYPAAWHRLSKKEISTRYMHYYTILFAKVR